MTGEVVLNKQDQEELLKFLESYARKVSQDDIDIIERKLSKKISMIRSKKIPHFVCKMISQADDLSLLVNLSTLPDYKHRQVIAALYYLIWSDDRTPDYLPIIGYLDDAFVIAMVHHRVSRDIENLKKERYGKN